MKREIAVINQKRKVVQGNPLLKVSYSMPQLPARVMRLIIAHIDDQRDEEFPQFIFSKKEMAEALGLTSHKTVKEDIKGALIHLQQHVIEFTTGEGEEECDIITSWIMKSRVWNYKDRVDIWLDGDLSPFLLDLKQRFYNSGQTFSKYRLEEVLSFRGDYSVRFFEWFNEYRWKSGKSKSGKWYIPELSLDEIRLRLGMVDEKGNIIKFGRWPDLQRFVIQTAVDEISEKSDFIVSWEVGSKKGKKVLGIVFHCEPKDKEKEQKIAANLAKRGDSEDRALAANIPSEEAFSGMPWKEKE